MVEAEDRRELREALLFSDGSFTVFVKDWPMTLIEDERKEVDRNEVKPEHLTKIVRVKLEVVEVLCSPDGTTVVPLGEVERLKEENEDLKRQLAYAKHCGA